MQHNNVEENRDVLASSDVCHHTEMRQSRVRTSGHAFHRPRVVFLALIDLITLSKTASAVPYGEAIEMEIQLVLMDTLPIINLCCEGGWGGCSRQIAAHVADVHYANVRCKDAVMSHKVGGGFYFPCIMEETPLIAPGFWTWKGNEGFTHCPEPCCTSEIAHTKVPKC